MNFFLRIAATILGKFSGYAMSNSMIKKLYAAKKEKNA
jgi:hypothetical protein